jgi:Flp pilus assembly protein TadG
MPHPAPPPSRPLRFWRNTAGVSAIEFALVLPVLLTILFGSAEFGRAYDARRKANQLARTVADLTSQGDTQSTVSTATMNDILASATLVLRPFSSTGVQIVVSAMGVDLINPGTKPRVCSSFATSNATARQVQLASDLTIPPGFQLPGMRYILTEVSYPYTPLFGSAVLRAFGNANNQFTFKVAAPWPVRGGEPFKGPYNEIVLPNGSSCP